MGWHQVNFESILSQFWVNFESILSQYVSIQGTVHDVVRNAWVVKAILPHDSGVASRDHPLSASGYFHAQLPNWCPKKKRFMVQWCCDVVYSCDILWCPARYSMISITNEEIASAASVPKIDSKVDLPAPFAPTTRMRAPRPKSKDTFFNWGLPPALLAAPKPKPPCINVNMYSYYYYYHYYD